MLKKLILSTIICGGLTLTAASAHAADVSWKTPEAMSGDSVADRKFAGLVWTDSRQCRGEGAIMFRKVQKGRWAKATPQISRCTSGSIGKGSLVRDSGSGHLYVLWSQANIRKPAESGIYFRRSTNGGRTWAKQRLLVPMPRVMRPVAVTGAARSGRLWVMYTNPRHVTDRTPPFRLEAYNPRNGRRTVNNMAVGSGKFRANNVDGALELHAAKLGLFALWAVDDAAGETHWHAADTTYVKNRRRSRLQLVFRGRQTRGAGTLFAVGEDRRPYRLTQTVPMPGDSAEAEFTVSRWSFTKHRYMDTYPTVKVPYAIMLGPAAFTFNVGRDRSVYIGYRAFPHNPELEHSQFDIQPLERTIAPGPAVPGNFVVRVTTDRRLTQAAFPWPFAAAAPAGSTVLEWLSPTRLERISTQFGGVRLIARVGHQVIDPFGDVLTAVDRTMVISDPLQFSPPPGGLPALKPVS